MRTKVKESSRLKTVQIITRTFEHQCAPECFKKSHKPKPKGLRKLSLGYVYQSSDGRFYIPWGDDDWLPVDRMTFGYLAGTRRVVMMFEPAVQLHIHSPGGKTVGKETIQKNYKVDESYHTQLAAKMRQKKGDNLRATQGYLAAEAKKIIDPAPRHRRTLKGNGHGAPGRPRTEQGGKVVALFGANISEEVAIDHMIDWYAQRELRASKEGIKKLVRRWYRSLKKTGHK